MRETFSQPLDLLVLTRVISLVGVLSVASDWRNASLGNEIGMAKILIVEDDVALAAVAKKWLESSRHFVEEARTGTDGLALMKHYDFDVVVLDIGLPGIDGIEVLKQFRSRGGKAPILVVTAKGTIFDKEVGYAAGADDYLTKPFAFAELLVRTKALLRRSFMPSPTRKTEIIVDDELTIDFSKREVWVRGEKVTLRPTEYRLLYHLVNNAGRLMTHDTLPSKVWGHEYRDESHYLRLYITYLRQKLERDPAHPKYILTERGVGYRFCELEPEAKDEVVAQP